MSSYSYVAIDPNGSETRGTLDVADQSEALRRIKEMGLFPMKVSSAGRPRAGANCAPPKPRPAPRHLPVTIPWPGGKVKTARLAVFTGQLATLVEAGMPLLRGLRILEQQEEGRTLKRVIGDLSEVIENGSSLTEAVAAHPRIFNRLYVNMVRAGEIGGALEITLGRLAEFMEKAEKLKGKVKAAMFYPGAVLTVAAAIVALLMAFVVPRFKEVFEGLMNGQPLPAFTRFVFNISAVIQHHILFAGLGAAALWLVFVVIAHTASGRWAFDQLKLALPVLGPLFRKVAISRFARTLGTLIGNGVPILQALTIVKETAGNVIIGGLIGQVHENVKQGEPIAPTLRASRLFPAMVAGMVDVGEETGALPEMLMKIADNYDDEVDNAASAMTSLLEPVLIVFLAVIVGSIVIAMFLPLIIILTQGFDAPGPGRAGD